MTNANTKKFNIQKNVNKLDEIIKYFEKDESEFDLDEALTKYEEAMELVASVRKELTAVEQRIEEIQAKFETE